MKSEHKATRPTTLQGSTESKRIAALVLEVLSGTKTTIDASRALGVTLARYYQLEARALQGVLTALEPKRRGGKRTDPGREIEQLRRDSERLQREVIRLQALLRASQRAIGIVAPARPDKSRLSGKRKKRPTARALRAVAALRTGQEDTTSPAGRTESKPEARGPVAGA
jgi:hypothetical protein